jgi:hypothetical protein
MKVGNLLGYFEKVQGRKRTFSVYSRFLLFYIMCLLFFVETNRMLVI